MSHDVRYDMIIDGFILEEMYYNGKIWLKRQEGLKLKRINKNCSWWYHKQTSVVHLVFLRYLEQIFDEVDKR